MSNKPHHSIDQVTFKKRSAFLNHNFFHALEKSGSVGQKTGWLPVYFSQNENLLYSFIKSHSYGEYIFDWQWAQAFEQHQLPYYPKLTSMLPFTPVTTFHFVMDEFDPKVADTLMDQYDRFYQSHSFSSSHFLFVTKQEADYFETRGYVTRASFQYHFINEGYESFEAFLGKLKSKKAKHIRNERQFPELVIKKYTGDELTQSHALQMYQFYSSTIDLKRGITYLTPLFFETIFQTMKENILYIEATKDGDPVAGTLFFYDDLKLYGRYWGSKAEIPNLHFELCYYQGIDFTIEHKLSIFEAGAQGEHKIARGFRPIKTLSSHHIKDPNFRRAIENFIQEEKKYVEISIQDLATHLPFKT